MSTQLEPTDTQRKTDTEKHESRNLLVLAGYQVVVRIGWIFKTESVIMPAFLDAVGDAGSAGWLRGCLPVLNRFGHSVPPILVSARVKRMRHKRGALLGCTLAMAAVFLILAIVWSVANTVSPALFLALYGTFFVAVGVNQLVFGTLQGKLIRAVRRGRLMLISNTIGALLAIGAAMWLLGRWLDRPDGGFHLVFAFTGILFAVASLAAILLVEPADRHHEPRSTLLSPFRDARHILRSDRHFRRLATVASLFGVLFILFPHYQAFAQQRLGSEPSEMMIWVVVQNLGTALFSLGAGPLADRRGNRVVLRISMLLALAAPVTSLVLLYSSDGSSRAYYPLVFLMVGLTPVTMRMLINYTLEIAPVADHPKYLGTLSLCVAAPILVSPAVGAMVDAWGFEPVFAGGSALIGIGWLLTFRLAEPRHRHDLHGLPGRIDPE